MNTEPDNASFLFSLSQELTARSNRIRYLIGDAHWLSDGYHNENVVRDFLIRYSPNSIVVSSGFLRSTLPNSSPIISPEIDILLTDSQDHIPLYSEGGLMIAEPDSVRAYLEIKSTFSRPVLRNALEHIVKVQESFLDLEMRHKVWRCIFFNTAKSNNSKHKTIFEEAKTSVSHLADKASYLPNCIVINGVSITFITSSESSVNLKHFNSGDYSLACALADIISNLRDESKALPETDLEQVIEHLSLPDPEKYSF
ncbi:MAG: DUF6602 domain-containing protein [Candidatus Thiodiazotropha sp.]